MTIAEPLITTAQSSGARRSENARAPILRELLHRGVIYTATPREGIRNVPVGSPSHFKIGVPASEAAYRACVALPYCFDLDAKDLISTVHADVERVLAEPFLHAAQRKYAEAVVRVPWAPLGELLRPLQANDLKPVFVFSVGRCGSTLLHALARTLMLHSYSEPDTITQLAVRPAFDLPPPEKQKLVWYALAPFIADAGPDPAIIKFRAQVNPLAARVIKAFPHARYAFMFRERENWARSIYRTFGKSPGAAARRLARGVHTAELMRNSAVSFELVRYEDLVASPLRVLAQVVGVESEVRVAANAAAVAELLGRDSQKGTSLSRDKLMVRADEDQWVQSFNAEWAKIRPDRLLQRLNLDV